MKRVATVVGVRPQFVKASAVSRELARRPSLREVMIHTGQHYDADLSDVFFEELAIPRPAYDLEVGSGSHGAQTAEMLQKIETVLIRESPDMLIVYGDTNSTLAGALAASKLQIPIAHVEAGLRSFNRRMPEEVNRVLTDHVSSLLFCPTFGAVTQLASEGIRQGVHHVGDVMFDVALAMGQADTSLTARHQLTEKSFVLATVHRAENTDDSSRLAAILGALGRVALEIPVVLPLHPRTRAAIKQKGLAVPNSIRIIGPVGLREMSWLERQAAVIVTDSGGVQKEAYFHRTPCITVRTETEWTETVTAGWNRLVDPTGSEEIVQAIRDSLNNSSARAEIPDYGSGSAAAMLVAIVDEFLSL
jgi:UDP-GlcNAc3NAcA epimerase